MLVLQWRLCVYFITVCYTSYCYYYYYHYFCCCYSSLVLLHRHHQHYTIYVLVFSLQMRPLHLHNYVMTAIAICPILSTVTVLNFYLHSIIITTLIDASQMQVVSEPCMHQTYHLLNRRLRLCLCFLLVSTCFHLCLLCLTINSDSI